MTATTNLAIVGGRQEMCSIKTDEEVRVIPYIKAIQKEALEAGASITGPGELNYLVTRLLRRYWKNSPQNYQAINDIVGAVEGAKQEFIRRIVNPYEDKKIQENGDVY